MVPHLGSRRVVALDQRSHGLSDRPPTGYAMANLVADATAAMAALNLNRPVVVGHSWGAAVALELAGLHPELVSGLTFIDGPIMSMASIFDWDQAQQLMQPPLPRFRDFVEATAQSQRDFESAWAPDLEPFVKARIMPDGDAYVLTLTAPVRLLCIRGLFDSKPDLVWPQLAVPAAALLASEGPQAIKNWRRSGAAELLAMAPDVSVHWFETPHDIPLYQPAEVAAEVKRICELAAALKAGSEPAA